MRLLYVTNGFPYPLTSGYLRHYFFIRELSRWHHITLLSLVAPTFVDGHARTMAAFTERVLTFPDDRRGGTRLGKAISRMRSAVAGNRAIRDMRAALVALLDHDAFDGVIFSGKTTFAAIADIALPPIVADLCDATSARVRQQLRFASPATRPLLWLDWLQVRRTERAILARADHVLFASARDRDAVPAPRGEATVLPNGIDCRYWRRSADRLGTNTLVFTGAMNYGPNADAAVYLTREILPLVREAIPNTSLLIVGHSPTAAVRELTACPGVTVTGFVEDVRPFLERAALFVAPLRFGAGIQNKLLEALSMAVPALASPLAADGLRTASGDAPPVLLAATTEQFARTIVQQLRRLERDPTPAYDGRHYVERHFNWERAGEQLAMIVEHAVHTRRTAQVA
jgi:glycosyltransferase involved in cell wall biosynthesis